MDEHISFYFPFNKVFQKPYVIRYPIILKAKFRANFVTSLSRQFNGCQQISSSSVFPSTFLTC